MKILMSLSTLAHCLFFFEEYIRKIITTSAQGTYQRSTVDTGSLPSQTQDSRERNAINATFAPSLRTIIVKRAHSLRI